MKIFISWSGEPSRQMAELLHDWLPDVIQLLQPWVSAKDVDKGAGWFEAIAGAIQDAQGYGIFCVTPDSATAPWLLFEAGAIGMADRGRVATFLHGLTPSELRPPLGLFQATVATSKDDVRALLLSINKRLAQPLAERQVDRAFEANWSRLAEGLSKIAPVVGTTVSKVEDPMPLLEEILSTVRRIDSEKVRGLLDYDSFVNNPIQANAAPLGLLSPSPSSSSLRAARNTVAALSSYGTAPKSASADPVRRASIPRQRPGGGEKP